MLQNVILKDAEVVWNNLKGIICVYKAADVKCSHIRKTIINAICSGLGELNVRPPGDYISITDDYEVLKQKNLADDIMVVGPRYQFKDVVCSWSSYLGTQTSGVLLLGINEGAKIAKIIRENKLARTYRVQGCLGQATDNYYKDGKIVEKSTFKFIKLQNIDRLLTAMQAAHQKKMFDLCGVENNSQAAYELAVKGLIRPASSKLPLIYGLKCVEFSSPYFTIEIQCINEYEMYLKSLIHEIGIKLHSTAHCTNIKCIRHGHFTLDHALLKKHWTLENIYTNMKEMTEILEKNKNIIHQDSSVLQ